MVYNIILYSINEILLISLYLSYISGTLFDGARIEVTLAKPVDKDSISKTSPTSARRQQQKLLVKMFHCRSLLLSHLPTLISNFYY